MSVAASSLLMVAFPRLPVVFGAQIALGAAAGIVGVVAVVIMSDLMRGSGRFNVARGLTVLCVGAGPRFFVWAGP
jgi:acetyl-CoA acetyltransferase